MKTKTKEIPVAVMPNRSGEYGFVQFINGETPYIRFKEMHDPTCNIPGYRDLTNNFFRECGEEPVALVQDADGHDALSRCSTYKLVGLGKCLVRLDARTIVLTKAQIDHGMINLDHLKKLERRLDGWTVLTPHAANAGPGYGLAKAFEDIFTRIDNKK